MKVKKHSGASWISIQGVCAESVAKGSNFSFRFSATWTWYDSSVCCDCFSDYLELLELCLKYFSQSFLKVLRLLILNDKFLLLSPERFLRNFQKRQLCHTFSIILFLSFLKFLIVACFFFVVAEEKPLELWEIWKSTR